MKPFLFFLIIAINAMSIKAQPEIKIEMQGSLNFHFEDIPSRDIPDKAELIYLTDEKALFFHNDNNEEVFLYYFQKGEGSDYHLVDYESIQGWSFSGSQPIFTTGGDSIFMIHGFVRKSRERELVLVRMKDELEVEELTQFDIPYQGFYLIPLITQRSKVIDSKLIFSCFPTEYYPNQVKSKKIPLFAYYDLTNKSFGTLPLYHGFDSTLSGTSPMYDDPLTCVYDQKLYYAIWNRNILYSYDIESGRMDSCIVEENCCQASTSIAENSGSSIITITKHDGELWLHCANAKENNENVKYRECAYDPKQCKYTGKEAYRNKHPNDGRLFLDVLENEEGKYMIVYDYRIDYP